MCQDIACPNYIKAEMKREILVILCNFAQSLLKYSTAAALDNERKKATNLGLTGIGLFEYPKSPLLNTAGMEPVFGCRRNLDPDLDPCT